MKVKAKNVELADISNYSKILLSTEVDYANSSSDF